MFYIHQTSCISAQQTFREVDLDMIHELSNNRLCAIEPTYEEIPAGVLRRMGKAVRMGVGAAMPLLQNNPKPDGIIIGTTNVGKEECGKFLNQIIEYDEGMLTPMNFVQSTPNAVAAQIALLTNNHGYNITHLQLGLAFENAMIDADMMLHENPAACYLLGGVDDLTFNHYNFEDKQGWYKKENISNKDLFQTDSRGSIAGEAATLFLVSNISESAIAKVRAIETFQFKNEEFIKEKLQGFLLKNLDAGEKVDLLLTGENGNNLVVKYYQSCESIMDPETTVARFKHMSGEFPTASALAVWLGCRILQSQSIPEHMIKRKGSNTDYKNILIYNTFKGLQHSFILISIPA